ncbi:unnamed protein product [Ambrosiozyma monospora]|uniref:Unnamed protein product n=1 Tax=Ambrosiozyma monospora TaxID=43982 RepID=A0ACB5SZF1_AMBMO|nr:unnamed protein product [Ambrosiozyma monospora]
MAFDADNSDKIIEEIMENLLLNINDTYNSLIFEPKLVMKFLRMRSNIGISQFYNYMKLIYMKHYFSQPLSVFWTQELDKVEMHNNYYEIFKRLPSVLNHQTSNDDELSQLYEAFSEDGEINIVRQLLKKNLSKLIHWRYDLRSLIEFLNLLQNHFSSFSDKTDKPKTKLWDNNLQLFSQLFKTDDEDATYTALETQGDSELRNRFSFLNPIWNQLREHSLDPETENEDQFKPANELIATLASQEDVKNFSVDFVLNEETFTLTEPVSNGEMLEELIDCLLNGLVSQLKELDLTNLLFREICCIECSTVDQLLKFSFNPVVRDTILESLLNSKQYLFNAVHTDVSGLLDRYSSLKQKKSPRKKKVDEIDIGIKKEDALLDVELFKLFEPSLIELYKLFREAGVTINIYDFYQVFKFSISNKKQLLNLMLLKLKNRVKKNGHNDDRFSDDENDEMLDEYPGSNSDSESSAGNDQDANKFNRDDKQLIKILERILKDCKDSEDDDEEALENNEEFDKITLSWFLRGFTELQMLGLFKEGKEKTETIEKIVWKGL